MSSALVNREARERLFNLKKAAAQETNVATRAIPGYTGHLRNAKDLFGTSAGKLLELDATSGIPVEIKAGGPAMGSTFISALDSEGAVWDHKFATTTGTMHQETQEAIAKASPRKGANSSQEGYPVSLAGGIVGLGGGGGAREPPPPNVVGYTGHMHMAQDVIGSSHGQAVRISQHALADQRAKIQPPEGESKAHWTKFVVQAKGAPEWKEAYNQTLTTRPNPKKSAPLEDRAANDRRRNTELAKQIAQARQIPGIAETLPPSPSSSSRSSPLKGQGPGSYRPASLRGAKSGIVLQEGALNLGPDPLFLKDNTLMTEAPADEVDYTGHFAQSIPCKRVVGYTGHLHGAQEAIGMNFGRVERRTNPYERPPEPPHPLGNRYQSAAPPAPALSPELRALVGRKTRPKASGVQIIDAVRTRILQRGGRNGFRTLTRILRIMDDDGNRALNRYEFQNGLNTFGIHPSPLEMDELMVYFDRDGSGQIDVTEFVRAIRGEMGEARRGLVFQAFKLLDENCDARVTMDDLKALYDVSKHPEVLAGEKTPKEALMDFAKAWNKNGDEVISLAEFEDYYNDISAGIDDDEYFELMMRNAWHLSGGEGAAANTTCRRVLVIHADGSQTVEEVKNDLGIGPHDEDRIRARLEQQGITDIRRIQLY